MSLTATVASPITSLCIVRSDDLCSAQGRNIWQSPVGLKPLRLQFDSSEIYRVFPRASGARQVSTLNHASEATHASLLNHSSGARHATVICAAALNATCAAEQTQTVTRQSSTITVAPIQGKEKSPELDDGGAGFPPRDDGDGGGGGGGGGGRWSGGFFLFGFLALLMLLKDQESEGPYQGEGRRRQKSYSY